MKTHFPMLLLLLGTAISSCTKEISCFGTDCVYPEAAVVIDSIKHDQIYTTLINQDGEPFVYSLVLSPEINRVDFKRFTGYMSFESQPKGEERILKVYYTAANQSYIQDDVNYINAFKTSLEIVAFGDDLKLTY